MKKQQATTASRFQSWLLFLLVVSVKGRLDEKKIHKKQNTTNTRSKHGILMVYRRSPATYLSSSRTIVYATTNLALRCIVLASSLLLVRADRHLKDVFIMEHML